MDPKSCLKRPPSTSLYIALFCTTLSAIFNYTLSIMASPYIVGDLGGSNDIATYTVSFYALGNALGIPLGRTMMPRIGVARLLILVLTLFAFFSWACAIAPNYPFFNASRFLQGFAAGPLYALIAHLFRCIEPRKGIFTPISLIIFTIGPVLGACWGGWVAYAWSWRCLFYLDAPLLLILAFFLRYRLKGFDDCPTPYFPFDPLGYASYFVGVFCLGFGAIAGQELDWFRSPLFTTLTAIGVPALVFFILWEVNHPHPILYLKLLKRFTLTFALFNLAILFFVYFGTIILLSLWLKLWANYTPDWIAALLGTMVLTGLLPVFVVNKQINRIDNRIFLAIAIVLLALSCFHTMIFNVEINLGRIVTSRLLAGLGLSFFLTPLFRLCFYKVQDEHSLHVVGLFQVTRALSSGMGASIYDIIWQRRQVFFRDRLGSSLTPLSSKTEEFFVQAQELGLKGKFADAQLDFYLQREATSLALDDCFYLMAWILIGLLLTFTFTFFAKQKSFVTAM
jgi:DHA2 family multidrug resistance protein